MPAFIIEENVERGFPPALWSSWTSPDESAARIHWEKRNQAKYVSDIVRSVLCADSGKVALR